MKNLFILFTFICLATGISFGQLSVQPSHPVTNKLEDIVQALVGPGVKVTNITSNYPSGSFMYGTFTEPSNALGITKGLVMTTGSVNNVLGPNNTSGISTDNDGDGDPDLGALVDPVTHDACVIEFDIVTSSTELSFNYIFGSDEYMEYVDYQAYNDIFAFLISGPGIVGTKNIALIPGTTTPVSINNVNLNVNSTYYQDNGDGGFTGGTVIQYDGYTVKLKAVVQVTPCNTYHLKLAIADVFDYVVDSGVLIESGSLSGTERLMSGGLIAPDSVHICEAQFPVELQAGVNTIPNYTWTKDGVQVGTGKVYNATAPGWYKVRAYRDNDCYWLDSINVAADPDFTLLASSDTMICAGGTAALNVTASGSSGYSYLWSPSSTLSDPSISNPFATPSATTSYSVHVEAGLCKQDETVIVSIATPLNLQAPTGLIGCVGIPVQLSASGAESYLWSPAGNLNDATSANPIAILSSDAVFKVVGSNTCYKDSVEVTVAIYPFPTEQAYGDTILCYGGTASLSADPSLYHYSWLPSGSLSNPLSANTLASPLVSTDYELTIDNHGCIKKDTVHVQVTSELIAKISYQDHYVEVPKTVHFGNASKGATEYTWYFTNTVGTDSSKNTEPDVDVRLEDYYTVVLKAMNSNGCYDYDTLFITAYKLFIPNLITPNQDGKNDMFEITGIGDQFSLEIYNRWGDRVYKKSNYRNEWNGEGLNDGIYYFVINDALKDKNYKGWVQLIR